MKLNIANKYIIRDGKSYWVVAKDRKKVPFSEIIKRGIHHKILKSWRQFGYNVDWIRCIEDLGNEYASSNACFMIKAETARYLVKNYPSYRHSCAGAERIWPPSEARA